MWYAKEFTDSGGTRTHSLRISLLYQLEVRRAIHCATEPGQHHKCDKVNGRFQLVNSEYMAGFAIDYHLQQLDCMQRHVVQSDHKHHHNPLNMIFKTRWPSG